MLVHYHGERESSLVILNKHEWEYNKIGHAFRLLSEQKIYTKKIA